MDLHLLREECRWNVGGEVWGVKRQTIGQLDVGHRVVLFEGLE